MNFISWNLSYISNTRRIFLKKYPIFMGFESAVKKKKKGNSLYSFVGIATVDSEIEFITVVKYISS